MNSMPNQLGLHFSPLEHARLWFLLAVVFFLLSFGANYWNEVAQYYIYLVLALIFTVLGLAPLVLHLFHAKSK